jgi:Ca2+-transporting ATPase
MTKSTSFLTIIGIIVVAQVVIVTWGGDVFSVEPQSLADWGKAIAIGASILIVGAMVRAIGRAVDPIAPAPAV